MKSKKISNVIIGFILLFVVLGIIGTLSFLTFGFQQEVTSLYLKYEDKILRSGETVYFRPGAVSVEVVYLLEALEEDTGDYTVEITPNAEKDFTFNLGETQYRFSDLSSNDLAKAFELSTADKKITMICENNMLSLLKRIFYVPITLNENFFLDDSYFNLKVTNARGEEFNINFGVALKVYNIKLTPSKVVF